MIDRFDERVEAMSRAMHGEGGGPLADHEAAFHNSPRDDDAVLAYLGVALPDLGGEAAERAFLRKLSVAADSLHGVIMFAATRPRSVEVRAAMIGNGK